MSPQSRVPVPSPDELVPVLLVSPSASDHYSLREILVPPSWQVHESLTCRQALEFLNQRDVPVLICERDQLDGTWRDLLHGITELPVPPSLIVFSRLADEYLWAEVLQLGGYDVLLKPFEEEEVARVALAAWLSWKRERGKGVAKEPAKPSGQAQTRSHAA